MDSNVEKPVKRLSLGAAVDGVFMAFTSIICEGMARPTRLRNDLCRITKQTDAVEAEGRINMQIVQAGTFLFAAHFLPENKCHVVVILSSILWRITTGRYCHEH